MAQIDQAGSGPELDRFDGDHERANLSRLGPEQPFPIVQVTLFPNFPKHRFAFRQISPQPQLSGCTAHHFLSHVTGQPAKPLIHINKSTFRHGTDPDGGGSPVEEGLTVLS